MAWVLHAPGHGCRHRWGNQIFISALNVNLETTWPYFLPGEDYAGYIEANKPLVFTTENIDPFLCGNNAGFCNWKFSQVYEAKELPIEDFGPSCTDVTDCNPKFESWSTLLLWTFIQVKQEINAPFTNNMRYCYYYLGGSKSVKQL